MSKKINVGGMSHCNSVQKALISISTAIYVVTKLKICCPKTGNSSASKITTTKATVNSNAHKRLIKPFFPSTSYAQFNDFISAATPRDADLIVPSTPVDNNPPF